MMFGCPMALAAFSSGTYGEVLTTNWWYDWYLTGSIPRTLETNAGIAQFLQAAEFHALGDDFDLRLPDFIASVTRDSANAAARRFLAADRAAIVVAGPPAPAAP